MMFGTAIFVPGPMRWFFIFFGVCAVAAALFPGDGPTELDADVWAPDPEECAANLKAKREAWKSGKPYVPRAELARWQANFDAARSQPWSSGPVKAVAPEERSRRLVRDHPMRAARWL